MKNNDEIHDLGWNLGKPLPEIAKLAQLETDIRDLGLEVLAREKRREILHCETLDEFLEKSKLRQYASIMAAIIKQVKAGA